jgi:hypothetical protein
MKKLPFLVIYVLTFFVSKSQPENGSSKKVKPFNVYITTVDNKSITATLRVLMTVCSWLRDRKETSGKSLQKIFSRFRFGGKIALAKVH